MSFQHTNLDQPFDDLPKDQPAVSGPDDIVLLDNTYKRTGKHPPRPRKFRPLPEHVVPQTRYDEWLFHSDPEPALTEPGPQMPVSNSLRFDAHIQNAWNQPRWCEAYRIEGRISVHPRKGYVFVDNDFFAQSSGYRPPQYHNSYQKLLNLIRSSVMPHQHVPKGLLLMHPTEHVYYHAIHDVMTRLAWAEDLGIPGDVPAILSEAWLQSDHGRQLMTSGLFQRRAHVVVKASRTLTCDTLYLLTPPHNSKRILDRIARSLPETPPDRQIGTKLFLHRKVGLTGARHCVGLERLIDALKALCFDVVDPATLTLSEQKWVFSRAEHLIGENGSGFTNMIFRQDGPLRIDALTPTKYPTATFQGMAMAYGFAHMTWLLPSNKTDGQIRSHMPDEIMSQLLNALTEPKE